MNLKLVVHDCCIKILSVGKQGPSHKSQIEGLYDVIQCLQALFVHAEKLLAVDILSNAWHLRIAAVTLSSRVKTFASLQRHPSSIFFPATSLLHMCLLQPNSIMLAEGVTFAAKNAAGNKWINDVTNVRQLSCSSFSAIYHVLVEYLINGREACPF